MIERDHYLPKSVPRLVLEKVRQVFVSEVVNSNVLVLNVPNKSLSQELKNVLFVVVICVIKSNVLRLVT